MRGKKAKAIRRAAEEATQGIPERNYRRAQAGGPVELHNCTRKAAKNLKKLYKDGLVRVS